MLIVEFGFYICLVDDILLVLVGIGICIEDDVWVIELGCDVFIMVLKMVVEIEEVMCYD